MNTEVNKNNIHDILKSFEKGVESDLHINAQDFRGKINLLISKTPARELRNEYTNLSILFEQIVNDYSFLLKNK